MPVASAGRDHQRVMPVSAEDDLGGLSISNFGASSSGAGVERVKLTCGN